MNDKNVTHINENRKPKSKDSRTTWTNVVIVVVGPSAISVRPKPKTIVFATNPALSNAVCMS